MLADLRIWIDFVSCWIWTESSFISRTACWPDKIHHFSTGMDNTSEFSSGIWLICFEFPFFDKVLYLLSKSTTHLWTLNCPFAQETVWWSVQCPGRSRRPRVISCRSSVRSSWVSHCAPSLKVAGSIPDNVIGIFYWQSFRQHCGPALDSVSNRNEYQGYFLEGKGGRCVGLTTFICGRSIAGTSASNPTRSVDDCCECCT